MKYRINYVNIPVLAIGFTEATSIVSKAIEFFQGSPTHVFFVTEDHGQLFATEETLQGLKENSLEKYTDSSNRIVALYVWDVFNDTSIRDTVQRKLAEVRRRAKEDSKYDWKGLLSFVPVLNKIFKPDRKKQWCSENVASILKRYGAACIDKTTISPCELYKIIQNHKNEFHAVLSYYI